MSDKKSSPRLAVVVPVGPNQNEEFVADTLESIVHYSSPVSLVVVDDSRSGLGSRVGDRFDATVITTPGNGLGGGLYVTISLGMIEALKTDFDILLRIDTDALVIGGGFEKTALDYFEANPQIGCLGSYRVRYDGKLRDFSVARKRITKWMLRGLIPNPKTSITLTRMVSSAVRNGYSFGESILGGVCIYSRAALEAAHSNGLLARSELIRTEVEEDWMFALALGASGFGLADFGGKNDDLPFGVKWIGLPDSPENLLAKGKKLIHSTKSYEEMSEADIRRVFANARR